MLRRSAGREASWPRIWNFDPGLYATHPPRGHAATRPRGALLAQQLMIGLPVLGFRVARAVPEDWGWCVPIENRRFALWIGCGPLVDSPDGHLCFIHPLKPRVWSWYGRVDTAPTVERLAAALESCIRRSGVAHHLRWWSEDEVRARR